MPSEALRAWAWTARVAWQDARASATLWRTPWVNATRQHTSIGFNSELLRPRARQVNIIRTLASIEHNLGALVFSEA